MRLFAPVVDGLEEATLSVAGKHADEKEGLSPNESPIDSWNNAWINLSASDSWNNAWINLSA